MIRFVRRYGPALTTFLLVAGLASAHRSAAASEVPVPILRLEEDSRVLAAMDSLAALFQTDRHHLGVDEAALESAGPVAGVLRLHRYLMREPLRAPGVVTAAAARLAPGAGNEPQLRRALDLMLEIGDYPPFEAPVERGIQVSSETVEASPKPTTLIDAMEALFAGTGERFRGRERETFLREAETLPPVLLEHLPGMLLELRAAVDVRNSVVDASDFGRGGIFGSATRHTREVLMGALLGAPVEGRDGAQGPPPEIPEGAPGSVRLDRLVAAGCRLAGALDAEADSLFSDPRVREVGTFRHTWFTPFGRIAVGGAGDDEYRGDYLLVVDLGGNDVYERAGGVTAGDAGVAALIDVAGNDRYGPADSARVAPGGAVLGIAGVWDLGGGKDVYESTACGSGFAFLGMAWVRDDGGDDRHHHGLLAQGSAGFGLGLLLDQGGEDVYELRRRAIPRDGVQWYPSERGCGQGYGGSAGLGMLIDLAGNDFYRATPVWGPQAPSPGHPAGIPLAQGAGAALLGRWIPQEGNVAGGTGWLLDFGGDDSYEVEQGQGYGVEAGLGVQFDAEGNDRYVALTGVGMGTTRGLGIHMDLAGNDSTSAGVGIGLGWELGQGVFVEAAGDDHYHWSPYGGGVALGDGAGWLLDLHGSDTYGTSLMEHEWSSWPSESGQTGRPSRSLIVAPGTGLLMDLEGPHHFASEKWSGIPPGTSGTLRREFLSTERRERLGIYLAPDR